MGEQRLHTMVGGAQPDLRVVLDSVSDGFYALDANWRFTVFNASAERFFGRTRHEVLGRTLWEAFPMARGTLFECAYRRVVDDQAQVAFETRSLVHPDRIVNMRAAPLPGGGLAVAFTDITERRQSEQRLHEALERFQLVLRATQDVIWDWDVVHDRIIWSESLQTVLGHDPTRVQPDLAWWMAHVHPGDRQKLNDAMYAALQDGAAHWSAEYRFLRADGRYADVLDRGYVLRNKAGRVIRMIGALLDLTERKLTEQALDESRAYLRSLLDSTDEGFYAIDPEGRVTMCNAAFLRLIGFEREDEVIGRDAHGLIHHSHAGGAHYPREQCPILRCAREGAPAHVVGEPYYRTDGKAFPVEYRASPVVRDGVLRGAICTFADISERLRTEAALRESEARFRNMADHAPVMMWLTDGDGRCTYLNRAWYEFTGQSTEHVRNCGWMGAVHEDDHEPLRETFVNAARRREPFRIECRLRRIDGVYRWVINTAAPRFDDQGHFLGFIGSVIDIDERREIETRLRHSEARLRLAASAASIGTWDFNPQTGELVWDAQCKALFGLPPDAPVDYDVFMRGLHPDDRERIHAAIQRVVSPDGADEFDTEFRSVGLQDGIERWIALKGRAYCDREGDSRRLVRFLGIAMDVTARKRTEAELRELNETLERRVQDEVAERARAEEALRQSQKLEAIGQLTGGVAHDFNNHLTVIRTSLHLLRQPNLADDKRQHYLDAIRETVERAAKLTGQLLAFARRQPLSPEVFDVADRVRASLDLLQTTLGGRVEVETELPETPCCVEADPNQFDTALLNLVLNARDAMDGKGRLRLRADVVERIPGLDTTPSWRGPFVALSVRDTGCGIPAHLLGRIFEPFYTTKETGRGTGLGLSQVFGFVKQSGGEVTVESEVGRGSEFTLYLPRVTAEVRPQEPEDTAPGEAWDGGGRLLLVEDNRQVGESTAQLLEQLGFEVVWRLDAAGALDTLARDGRYDLLLTDIVMPGPMSGLELAREVERRHPALPIVLTTGYSHALASAACNRYPLLRKPFTAEAVSQVLARTLRRHRARATS